MAGIELEIILHLWIPQAQFLMSQCVKTPASFSNRQGCDGGSSEAFRHVAEASFTFRILSVGRRELWMRLSFT